MSAFGAKADMSWTLQNVRERPKADIGLIVAIKVGREVLRPTEGAAIG